MKICLEDKFFPKTFRSSNFSVVRVLIAFMPIDFKDKIHVVEGTKYTKLRFLELHCRNVQLDRSVNAY